MARKWVSWEVTLCRLAPQSLLFPTMLSGLLETVNIQGLTQAWHIVMT